MTLPDDDDTITALRAELAEINIHREGAGKYVERIEASLARAEVVLEEIARIPTNLKVLGEDWTARMATHGAEARDAAIAFLGSLKEGT